jgi:hypothetical protein
MADPASPPPSLKAGLTVSLVLLAVLLGISFFAAAQHLWVLLAGCLGALGGLAHELTQSQGRFIVPRPNEDGVYLGTLMGLVLGAVAGIVAAPTFLNNPTAYTVGFGTFFAGLGVKGAADAALGTAVTQPVQKVEQASGGVARTATGVAGTVVGRAPRVP